MARALLLHPYRPTVRGSSSIKHDVVPEVKLSDPTRNYRVLVLGGTGRVGGSTATALSKLCSKLSIVVGGRNREKGEAMVAKLGENSEFSQVDINDTKMLETSLRVYQEPIGKDSLEVAGSSGTWDETNIICCGFGFGSGGITVFDVDLVVHAAGPFQQAPRCTVLEAAIKTKTAYVDVCDDTSYAFRAKSLENEAVAANIPAITTAGIYPGVSNVMAAEMVAAARSEEKGNPEKLRFSYYTAGTGGAGPTILATSFLLLGEEVTAYKQGEKVKLRPYSGKLNVDFGKGIRKRDVYLLNLPEVRSTHEVLGVPTVSARFGTAPFFWNWGMEIMTKILPSEVLRDRTKVQQMVDLFDPVVRAMDGFSGERVSMRVDLECSDGRSTVGLYSHKKLSVAVGDSTAAFVLAMLEGSTQPGVWFPEEPQGIAVEAREVLLRRASQGTINFILNKPPWMVDTDPKEVILGIYV